MEIFYPKKIQKLLSPPKNIPYEINTLKKLLDKISTPKKIIPSPTKQILPPKNKS